MKTWLNIFLGALVRPVVPPVFWTWRWIKFTVGMGVMRGHLDLMPPHVRRNVLLSLPLTLPCYTLYRAARFLAKSYRREFAEYALRRYARMVGRHYGKGGLCYSDIAPLSDADLEARWAELAPIRLGPFIDRYPFVLDYRDGETFLDAGCGMGGVIKELAARYPQARLQGFDLNPDAIRMVRAGTAASERVSVEVGSLTDPAQLAKFPDRSVDHVVLCNVFHYIVGAGIAESAALRRRIVAELVRISRRSVLLMMDEVGRPADTRVEIVSADACFIRDDVPGYFDNQPGECLVVSSDRENIAVLFRHHDQDRGC